MRTTADGVRYEFMSERVRKLIFIGIIAMGALVGLLSAVHDDWATRAVMAAVGALFAVPIGAVLTQRLKPEVPGPAWDETLETSAVSSPKALAANYWRDKGHPPFMKPPGAEPDKHMFDPDKLG